MLHRATWMADNKNYKNYCIDIQILHHGKFLILGTEFHKKNGHDLVMTKKSANDQIKFTLQSMSSKMLK